MPQQRIILWRGSESDNPEPFTKALGDLADLMQVVTCSVHKEPVAGAAILHKMVQEVPDTIVIAYIGRSNGAGPTLSAMSTVPVITVPASAKEFPEDVWSSLRAPSKVPVMTVLEPSNAVLAALQDPVRPQSEHLRARAQRDRGPDGEYDSDLGHSRPQSVCSRKCPALSRASTSSFFEARRGCAAAQA